MRGDHLAVRRGGRQDHAIDLGDRTVLRFAPGAGFRRLLLSEFAAGPGRVEVVVHRERTYPPAAVVSRAFSRLSQAAFEAMFASAEQFASWCKSGQLPAVPGALPVRARKGKAAAIAPRKRGRAAKRAASKAERKASKAGPKARVARKPGPASVGSGRAGRAAARKGGRRRRR